VSIHSLTKCFLIAITVALAVLIFPADAAPTLISSNHPGFIIAMAMAPAAVEVGGKAAFSIEEFCRAHGISRSLYYELKRAGLGPVEMHLRNRRAISQESAAAWRCAREEAASQSATA
jgi:hypothetical protein